MLAFAAGVAFAFPLATRPSFLGSTCGKAGPAGATLQLRVVSATRDGAAVTPPENLAPYLFNRKSLDASTLEARFLDAGDQAGGTAAVVTRTVRRLP